MKQQPTSMRHRNNTAITHDWVCAGRLVTLQTRYFLFIAPQCVISTFRPNISQITITEKWHESRKRKIHMHQQPKHLTQHKKQHVMKPRCYIAYGKLGMLTAFKTKLKVQFYVKTNLNQNHVYSALDMMWDCKSTIWNEVRLLTH